jgi:hypothetical protein
MTDTQEKIGGSMSERTLGLLNELSGNIAAMIPYCQSRYERYYDAYMPSLTAVSGGKIFAHYVSDPFHYIKPIVDDCLSRNANKYFSVDFDFYQPAFAVIKIIDSLSKKVNKLIYDESLQYKTTLAEFYSLLFGAGFLWYNYFTDSIEVLGPWEIGYSYAEMKNAGSIQKCRDILIKKRLVNESAVKEIYHLDAEKLPKILDRYNFDIYLSKDSIAIYAPQEYHKPVFELGAGKVDYAEWSPCVSTSWNISPITGITTSLVDDLDPYQMYIDLLVDKMTRCDHVSDDPIILVNSAYNIKPSELSAPGVSVLTVDGALLNQDQPLQVIDRKIDNSALMAKINQLKSEMYEVARVAELKSMFNTEGFVPKSGIAIAEMTRWQSEGFQTQHNQYIELTMNSVYLLLRNMKDKVARENLNNLKITPVIGKQYGTEEQAEDVLTNDVQICDKFIYDCVEKDSYNIPEFINLPALRNRIQYLEGQCFLNDELEIIAKLRKLDVKARYRQRLISDYESRLAVDANVEMMSAQQQAAETPPETA